MSLSAPPAKLRVRPDAESPVSLPDDLITQVLLFSNVKSLMRMRCVCKSWKSIISHPKFTKLHLKLSTQNPRLILSRRSVHTKIVFLPVRSLIEENPLINLLNDPLEKVSAKDCRCIFGSCNGLFCCLEWEFSSISEPREFWFRVWNPTMGTVSKKLGHVCRDMGHYTTYKFAFGYDNSSETYKAVMLMSDEAENRTIVRVLSVGDNVWKTISNFPVSPLLYPYTNQSVSDVVYLNGSLNWLGVRDSFGSIDTYGWKNINGNLFVIVSLDLGTESYTQLMPPHGFIEMSAVEPSICILKDCLCFSHDYRRTEFVIWQMKKFGVEESWTQLLKISYQNLQSIDRDLIDLKYLQWFPLHLSDCGDTLILANDQERQAILYNLRLNKGKRSRIADEVQWFSAMIYVESLVCDI